MKAILVLSILILAQSCASALVNVDPDSCQQRGTLDGVKVSQCKVVKNVK